MKYSYYGTIVSRKRAHGQCTLLSAQTGGWANICNIAAFYHEKVPMFTLSQPSYMPTNTLTRPVLLPAVKFWIAGDDARHLSLPAPYARKAMNRSARNCVQHPTAKAHAHRNSSTAVLKGLDMFLEKYQESAGTFWRGTKQLQAKLQTLNGSVL